MRSTLSYSHAQALGAPLRIVVALAICCVLACAKPSSERLAVELTPVPNADLSGLDSGARNQLLEQRAIVDRMLAGTATAQADLAEAYAELGLLHIVYDLFDPAGTCFENSLHLAPEDVRWHYLLGYLRGRQGELEEAVANYRRALEIMPESLPALLRLGRDELTLGRPEAARAAFERALALDAEAAAAHEGLGRVANVREAYGEAIGHFERALALDPAANAIHYALAQSHRNLGHLEEARSHLERAGDVTARIRDPLIDPLASRAESIQFYLAQGAEALDDRAFDAAAAAFEAALERDSTSFGAYRGLAISLERLGDTDGARRVLRTALDQGRTDRPDHNPREQATVLRSLGLLEATVGRSQQALEHYLASLELHAAQPDVILRAANALARGGRFEEAIAWYDRLVELTPEWAPAVLEKRATALVNLGRHDEAVADFTRATEAVPTDRGLRLRFAEALDFMGDSRAAAVQREAAARSPEDDRSRVKALVSSARQRAASGDFKTATEHLRAALEIAPQDLEVRFELATILGHIQRFEESAKEFGAVVASTPRNTAARRGEIVALVLNERYAAARDKLQDALRSFPRHAGFALTQTRLLATAPDPGVRNSGLALEIARRVSVERQDPLTREALAIAHAAAGQTAEAVALQQQLVAEAESTGDIPLISIRRARLEAFEAGRSWTAQTPREILTALAP